MSITWNTGANAPGCPGQIVDDDTGQTMLVLTNWDCPRIARSFGWLMRDAQACPECGTAFPVSDPGGDPSTLFCGKCDTWQQRQPCEHSGTDGTVDCAECGLTATDFISMAYEWLEEHDGATADDPDYFQED